MSKQKFKPFSHRNNYYDLLYHNKDYEKEANYVVNIIKTTTPNAKSILELGCGTGNYPKYFCQQGFQITGIELSEPMTNVARSKAIEGFDVVNDDIATFELNTEFDAAIALFHVISYLTANEKVIECFRQVNKHLKKNSLFVFDVWYTPAVYIQRPHRRVKQISDNTTNITRVANPVMNFEANTVDVNYEITIENSGEGKHEVLHEAHTLRHFSTPEIKMFAQLTGFKVLRAEEFLTAKTPSPDTWGVCYILQKHE